MTQLGLRIDVDTLRGTRLGVPKLCQILARHNCKATFYFCVGPDNMGRHLWRLLKPAFLIKMLRTNAPGLYGWDIILRGTFFPGPLIGKRCADIIRSVHQDGHEIGLHAWDHHLWQAHIEKMSPSQINEQISRGVKMLESITGEPVLTSAVPGWRCTDQVLLEKAQFPFVYNSDCRGSSCFMPVVPGHDLKQAQVPVTLPTYDEIINRDGVTDENYNDVILAGIERDALNVYTIHAEAEGIIKADLFDAFLGLLAKNGIEVVPLINCMKVSSKDAPAARIRLGELAGREGRLALQEDLNAG